MAAPNPGFDPHAVPPAPADEIPYLSLLHSGDGRPWTNTSPANLPPGSAPFPPQFGGNGWNLIGLPYGQAGAAEPIRVMLNNYEETFAFDTIATDVFNRGTVNETEDDQTVASIDYIQTVTTNLFADFPVSANPVLGPPKHVHHENGMWFRINHPSCNFNIGRSGTIPHGNSILLLGNVTHYGPNEKGDQHLEGDDLNPVTLFNRPGGVITLTDGNPETPEGEKLPLPPPYVHFRDDVFKGTGGEELHLNDTVNNLRIAAGNVIGKGDSVDPDFGIYQYFVSSKNNGSVSSIPFFAKDQAGLPCGTRRPDVTSMEAYFWTYVVNVSCPKAAGKRFQVLQYFQRIDFNIGGVIYPHTTANTMTRGFDIVNELSDHRCQKK